VLRKDLVDGHAVSHHGDDRGHREAHSANTRKPIHLSGSVVIRMNVMQTSVFRALPGRTGPFEPSVGLEPTTCCLQDSCSSN
jgi:hypothetical protein